MARIQVSVPDEVLEKIDKVAKDLGVNRSAFLVVAAGEYISAREKAPKLTAIFSELADTVHKKVSGMISDSEYQESMSAIQKQVDELKR